MPQRPQPSQLETIPRKEFLEEYFDYKAGEHLTIVSPTGGGKTYLGNQLLQATDNLDLPAVVLVMKPVDETSSKFAKASSYKIVKDWPARLTILERLGLAKKAPGHLVWPPHSFDPDIDDPRHWAVFRKAILDSYKQGHRRLVIDEGVSLERELKLAREVKAVHTKGRSGGTGVWLYTQRPRNVELEAYSSAEHLLLGYTPDGRDREVYGEIGGVDRRFVEDATGKLEEYNFLYIKRTGNYMCIVGP